MGEESDWASLERHRATVDESEHDFMNAEADVPSSSSAGLAGARIVDALFTPLLTPVRTCVPSNTHIITLMALCRR